MNKIVKKITAAALAAVMMVTASACNLYSEDNLWAAEKGEYNLSIGGYIYYLRSAYAKAAEKVSTESEVLKSKIDDVNAEEWIRADALESINKFIYVNEKFDELGLSLSDEDKDTMETNTDVMWSWYGNAYETYGISRDSFNTVYNDYSTKYTKIFEHLYGKDGEFAVSDEELTKYYEENYYNYATITLPMTETDEEGNTIQKSDEDKEAIKKDLEDMIEDIKGGKNMQQVAAEYTGSKVELTDQTIYATADGKISDASTTVQNLAVSLKEGEISDVTEIGTSSYCFVMRLPISDLSKDVVSDDEERVSVLSYMKSEEFEDYVIEKANEISGITFNDSAMKKVNISSFAADGNKNGTLSEASETSDTSEAE